MAVILISAELPTVLESSAPSAEAVAQAFRDGRPGAASSFGWVGPSARVTREARVGDRFYTRASWLGAWPAEGYDTDAPLASSAEAVRASVAAKLNALVSGWTVTAVPYAPAVNGSLEWWRSGAATATRTRGEFPELAGRLDALENPIGPTTAESHPSTGRDVAEGAARAASGSLPWLTLGAVALAVGLVAWRFGGRQSVIVLDTGRGGARRLAA